MRQPPIFQPPVFQLISSIAPPRLFRRLSGPAVEGTKEGVGILVAEQKRDLGARHCGTPELLTCQLFPGRVKHLLEAAALGAELALKGTRAQGELT